MPGRKARRQLPPRQRFDRARLDEFLHLLPRDTAAAKSLARRHDRRPRDPGWPSEGSVRPISHALEVRHPGFCTEEFIALLRAHEVALVVADSVEWPLLEDVTSDLVYVRLHGSEEIYASGYDEAALQFWAARAKAWSAGREPTSPRKASAGRPPRRKRDVYVFFDNDMKVRAPYDAQRLIEILS